MDYAIRIKIIRLCQKLHHLFIFRIVKEQFEKTKIISNTGTSIILIQLKLNKKFIIYTENI